MAAETDESTESLESIITVSKHLSEKLPELKQLESCLTCLICYAPLLHPNSTPCNHLFCSVCIRRSIQYKQACPSCNLELHESDLTQDKTSEKLLPIFQALVKRLASVNLNGPSEDKGKENCSPNSQSNKALIENSGNLSVIEKRQTCPHCKVSVARNFETHVKQCQEAPKIKPEVQIIRKKPTPLPKLVYSLLKDTDLRKKCKEFGLNSKGDKTVLIKRLQKYTILYNAEVLLDNSRSKLQIAMQVEKEEKEEKAGRIARPEALQYDRNTAKEEIEVKQKTYLKDNKSDFSSLVKLVKERNVCDKPSKIVEDLPSKTLIETVENLEDICAKEDNQKIVVDEPGEVKIDFEQPGKTEFDPEPGPSTEPRAFSTSSVKRKSSPIDDSKIKQPPLKLVKTLKGSNLTPHKSEVKSGVGSPTVSSQNIFAKLTQSAEQRKQIPKQECPVCGVQVPEKFINIHLDKCLDSGNTESRSASKSSRNSRSRGISSMIKKQSNVKKNESQEDEDEDELDLDLSQDDVAEIKPSIPDRTKLPRSVVKSPIIESSQVEPEREKTPCKEEEEAVASPPESPLYYRYTETISQSQHDSEKDMFAVSDNEECASTVSSNLLDLDDEIEEMMKEALKEEDAERKHTEESVKKSKATRATRRRVKKDDDKKDSKHLAVSVLPKPRKTRSRANTPDVPSTSEASQPIVKRTSTRRTIKSKL